MAQNRTRWIPDTYIIIFFVVLFAALLTWTVPVGKFETHEITYTMGSSEKSRSVLVPESFQYELGKDGKPVMNGVKLFEPYGETGILNYAFEGSSQETSGDRPSASSPSSSSSAEPSASSSEPARSNRA